MRMRRRAKEALAYGAPNQVLIKVLGFPRAPLCTLWFTPFAGTESELP